MSKSTAQKVETVPASTHFSMADANDSSVTRFMQKILSEGGTDAVAKITAFANGREVLGKPLRELIESSKLPVAQVEDLDAKIENENKAITEHTAAMSKATAEIDKEMAALEAKRSELAKPFEEKISKHREAATEAANEKNERVQPVIEAIDQLHGKMKELAEKHDVPSEFVTAYVKIDSPARASAPKSGSTGTGRGRGGAVKVRITKAGVTSEFSSLNAARTEIYRQTKGEEPKHGANAASCTRFLESAGYAVEQVG